MSNTSDTDVPPACAVPRVASAAHVDIGAGKACLWSVMMEQHISGLPVARQVKERPPAAHLLEPRPRFVDGVAANASGEGREDGHGASQAHEFRDFESFGFRTSPRCLGRTAGGGRPGAAAHPHSRTVNAVAAVRCTDPAPPRSVPTRSARRTVGPPITTGHTPMRAEDPTARGKIPCAWDLTTIRSMVVIVFAPLLSRSGEWAMTAIAYQTRDELD